MAELEQEAARWQQHAQAATQRAHSAEQQLREQEAEAVRYKSLVEVRADGAF